MLTQTYLLDEVEVGIEDFLRRVVAEYTDEEGDNAFDNEGIALCGKVDEAVGGEVCGQPHAALAAVDEVLLNFGTGGQRLLLIAQVDEQLVLVHPVLEVGELFYDLVLYLVDGHGAVLIGD